MRRRRSASVRGVACVAVCLILSQMWYPALASLPGPVPRAAAAPGPRERPPEEVIADRLAPVAVDWTLPDGARSAAVLFDGDRNSSLRSVGEARIVLTLPEEAPVRGLGAFGAADGSVSVAALDPSGRELPLSGLQNLDLRGLPLRW